MTFDQCNTVADLEAALTTYGPKARVVDFVTLMREQSVLGQVPEASAALSDFANKHPGLSARAEALNLTTHAPFVLAVARISKEN